MKEIRMRAFFGILGLAGAGFLLSSVTSTVGCGSSSNAGSTGTAGSTGHGGTTGTAGTTGSGGTSSGGSGGGGGSGVALGCQVSDPPPDSTGLIADFMTVDAGAPVLAIGGTYTYGSGVMTAVENGAWHVTATSTSMTGAQYWGAGLYFNGNAQGTDCIDATMYTGVQFDIKGMVGTGCMVQYMTVDSQHAENTAMNTKASGDSTSYPPQLDITTMLTTAGMTLKVPFTGTGAPSGGNPALGVAKDKLIGVQWQLTTPASMGCMLDLTIDNVKFYQ